ncbi:DUF3597 domain-containing protein [Pseudomonas kuykendallii]|uniref:DUF3597 domain-containing protein n=1 Tax=Pseudomonas kuykendallii TaxID=1007099 RepID=UPI0028D23E19|nr:DUF3597 domain-containing protein [Pseudomonas kuykendallii]
MGLLSSILEKLGIGHHDEVPSLKVGPDDSIMDSGGPNAASNATTAPGQSPAQSTTPVSATPVDVSARLNEMAAQQGETLNWRTSIVDLLKLLGLDSSLQARKELATELGCPADKMADSAQMNIWLHKAVLNKLAENGGNVPADLLD